MSAPLRASRPGLTQVVHGHAGADGRRIDAGEEFQHLVTVFSPTDGGDVGQHAVGCQVGHGGDGNAAQGHGPGQPLAEVYALQHVLAGGVQVADDAAQPAFGAHLVRLAGMPDVHGAEVGARRVLVADAVDDGHLALVPQVLDRPHSGMEGQVIGKFDELVFRQPQIGPIVPVKGVGKGNHRVQIVVGAGELQDHQHRVFLG